jgi:hypothetical protein
MSCREAVSSGALKKDSQKCQLITHLCNCLLSIPSLKLSVPALPLSQQQIFLHSTTLDSQREALWAFMHPRGGSFGKSNDLM